MKCGGGRCWLTERGPQSDHSPQSDRSPQSDHKPKQRPGCLMTLAQSVTNLFGRFAYAKIADEGSTSEGSLLSNQR